MQIGPSVQIYTAGHPTDPETRRSGLEFALPVTVGNNAWIGGGSILCPGVTIGANTVVGPGAWWSGTCRRVWWRLGTRAG